MPYRQTEPVRTWTLRTSKQWSVLGVAGAALGVGGPLWLALETWHFRVGIPIGYVLVALPGLAIIAVWKFGGDGYRVHGGHGPMRLYPDRLEIPRARKTGCDVMALNDLAMGWTRYRVRFNFVAVNEVLVLELRAGALCRTISERIVGGERELERIADDIGRMQRGEPLRDLQDRNASSERDDLDARLDAELAKLD